ncbi:hypothetical protein Tco_0486606 [Tanacetum coccineum]
MILFRIPLLIGKKNNMSLFKEDKEVVYCTDDESVKDTGDDIGEVSKLVNSNAERDGEGVSDTYFEENEDNSGNEHNSEQPMNEKETFHDPFNIYDLLRKRNDDVVNSGSDKSTPYPLGFTPEKDFHKADEQGVRGKGIPRGKSQCRSEGSMLSELLEDAQT